MSNPDLILEIDGETFDARPHRAALPTHEQAFIEGVIRGRADVRGSTVVTSVSVLWECSNTRKMVAETQDENSILHVDLASLRQQNADLRALLDAERATSARLAAENESLRAMLPASWLPKRPRLSQESAHARKSHPRTDARTSCSDRPDRCRRRR
jgi:hypothetical protein